MKYGPNIQLKENGYSFLTSSTLTPRRSGLTPSR